MHSETTQIKEFGDSFGQVTDQVAGVEGSGQRTYPCGQAGHLMTGQQDQRHFWPGQYSASRWSSWTFDDWSARSELE